jgi:hypothetical protein
MSLGDIFKQTSRGIVWATLEYCDTSEDALVKKHILGLLAKAFSQRQLEPSRKARIVLLIAQVAMQLHDTYVAEDKTAKPASDT